MKHDENEGGFISHLAELRKRLEEFLNKAQKEAGYEMVISPHIGNKKLYETSGHFQNKLD